MKINEKSKLLYEYLIQSVFTKYIQQVNESEAGEFKNTYMYWVPYAEELILKLDEIYVGFLERCMPFDELKKYDCWNQLKVKASMLNDFQRYCYEYIRSETGGKGFYKFLGLQEQNEKARRNMHGDFSAKRPRAFGEA